LVAFDVPLGPIDVCLVGPVVDLEEDLVFLDFRAFLERHLHQVASDARPNIHRERSLGSPREVDVVGDVTNDRLADAYRYGIGSQSGGLLLMAPGKAAGPQDVEVQHGGSESAKHRLVRLSVDALAPVIKRPLALCTGKRAGFVQEIPDSLMVLVLRRCWTGT